MTVYRKLNEHNFGATWSYKCRWCRKHWGSTSTDTALGMQISENIRTANDAMLDDLMLCEECARLKKRKDRLKQIGERNV